jgi:hypothetical protein
MTRPAAAAVLCLLLAPPAAAHSFGKLYNLPVPLWLYLYGAAAALVASFLVVGFFVNVRSASLNFRTVSLDRWGFFRSLDAPPVLMTLRFVSVASLLLCIVTGLLGSNNPYTNFNMTFFWIVFVLGFTYLTALVGDLYSAIGPWRVLTDAVERWRPGAFAGRRPWPQQWAYYPALVLYMAFIWIELFGGTRPLSLSLILLGYTILTLAAAWWWGRDAWFRHGEFFGVFFRLIAKVAPFEYVDGRVRFRQPFTGLLQESASHKSLLLFVLFMLSSTAFDGIKDTVFWVRLFWKHLFHAVLPLTGSTLIEAYPAFKQAYAVWQAGALVLSAYLYLGVYLAFIWLAKKLTRVGMPVQTLALRFAFSLIPIALVYNITHYYTLIATQGTQIVRLVSDPFGFGWNLFDTRLWLLRPIILDAGTVWHTQVWLILFGHIVSVYLAHVEALRVFPTQRQATLSQLPMLLLMVAFTTIGLWILGQPISAGQGPG